MNSVRKYGYSDETIRNINATLRKLIHLCYRKKLVATNILEYADNIRTKTKSSYRIIPKEEFDAIINYLKTHKSVRSGVNNYPKYVLMFSLLYYTGIRLGELFSFTNMMILNFFLTFKKGEEPEDMIFWIFQVRKT